MDFDPLKGWQEVLQGVRDECLLLHRSTCDINNDLLQGTVARQHMNDSAPALSDQTILKGFCGVDMQGDFLDVPCFQTLEDIRHEVGPSREVNVNEGERAQMGVVSLKLAG